VIKTGATLDFTLSDQSDPSWGADPADAVPSYTAGQLPAVGYSVPSGGLNVTTGTPGTLGLGAASADGRGETIEWHAADLPAGVTVTPSSGTLTSSSCGQSSPAPTGLRVTATEAGSYPVDITLRTASGQTLPPVVVDLAATG
jgi:hypothetical protein